MNDSYHNATREHLSSKQPGHFSNEKRGEWYEIFLSRTSSKDEIDKSVKNLLKEKGRLFLAEKECELDIFTEPTEDFKEMKHLEKLFESLGYRVLKIKLEMKQGKYLCSDYGCFGCDYYEYWKYTRVTIVSA